MHIAYRVTGKLEMSSTNGIFLQFLPSHLLNPLNKYSQYPVLRGGLTILFLHTISPIFKKTIYTK